MPAMKDEHTVGTPEKPRGQQTGFAGNPDQNREEKKETPAIKGNRPRANKMAGEASQQQVSTDAVTPNSNTPSTAVRDVKTSRGSGG
jgi:hypothetical protein